MKLLLDSANIEDVKRIAFTDAISGVTTNPSLMAKEEKGDYTHKLIDIAEVLNESGTRKHMSVEVITLDPDEMVEQAVDLAKHFESKPLVELHIKIPVTLDNLQVITALESKGIKVNATACMMHSQAKMALDAGASIVSYFYNRIIDGGGIDPNTEIHRTSRYMVSRERSVSSFPEAMLSSQKGYITVPGPPQIICGSIRKPEDVTACWLHGASHVTASMKIIEQLLSHPQTDIAINGFQKDIEAWLE